MKFKQLTGLFLFCIVIDHLNVSIAAESEKQLYVYQEITDGKTSNCICQFEPLNTGYSITVIYTDSKYKMKTDHEYNVCSCEVIHNNSENTLHGKRVDKFIHVSKDDLTMKKEIGKLKWFQTPFLLAGFIQTGKKRTSFVQVAEYDEDKDGLNISIMKMVAKKEKQEKINVNGKMIDAVKTTITLPGIKSLFWKITYWYRLSDGMVVKYADVRGGPGTPKTTGTLIKEERQ